MIRRGRLGSLRACAVALLITGIFLLAAPAPAHAHPIGNFTLNLYSGIEVAPGRVHIEYVLEMAEISTQEQKPGMDLDQDGEISEAERDGWAERATDQILTNLSLVANGQPVELRVLESSLWFREGQGGLDLLYMHATIEGSLPESGRIDYHDGNYSTRPGWREITARPAAGITISASTVPQETISDELQAYPSGADPLNVREASFSFQASTAATEPTSAATTGPVTTSPAASDGFANILATASDRALPVLLLLSFGFGFIHALGPGHGKTIMAASSVAGSMRVRHAITLGSAVALMHCASVIGLGLIALAATRFFSSEHVFSGLRVFTGVLVLVIGGYLLIVRWRRRKEAADGHTHSHADGSHTHAAPGVDGMGIAAAAAAGGLLPSPTAVVVLLGAIATDQIALGVALVLTFSVGLGAALVLVGVLSVSAKALIGDRVDRVAAWMPVGAAAVIFVVGLILTVQAVSSL